MRLKTAFLTFGILFITVTFVYVFYGITYGNSIGSSNDNINNNVINRNAHVSSNETCYEKTVTLSSHPLPITGLLSFPGSGNTWTRHLIQQMTGLATSSCYCDAGLQRAGFPFECHSNKSLSIVTKTHRIKHVTDFNFQKIVFLVRNPYDAYISYANFNAGNHISKLNISRLIKVVNTMFNMSQRTYIDLVKYIHSGFKGPIFILQYEKLRTEMASTLHDLAGFLNVNVSNRDIDCTIKLQEGNFHRKTDESDHVKLLRAVFNKQKLKQLNDTVTLAERLIREATGLKVDIGGHTKDILLS